MTENGLNFCCAEITPKEIKKLKGTPISISEDFSETMRRKRKHLWEYAKSQRQDGDKVRLRHDILTINGTKYTYDEVTGQVIAAT